MNYKDRFFKFILIISSSILLMLVFAFLLTYDFKKESKYIQSGYDSFTNKLIDSSNSIDKLNYLNLSISEYELKNYISDALKGNKDSIYLYEGLYWTIKGIDIEYKNSSIKLILYTSYHRSLNYELKLNILVDINEYDEYFLFQIKSISFGSLIVPSDLVEKTLKETKEDSIGGLVNILVKNLSLSLIYDDGVYVKTFKEDIPSLLYYLNKTSVLSDINYESFKILLDELLHVNKRILYFENNLTLRFNFNSLINKDEIELNYSYLDILNILLGNTNINSLNAYLNYVIEEDDEIYDIYKINSYTYLDKLYIEIFNSISNKSITYLYALHVDDFSINSIYVGKDKDKNNFITVNKNNYEDYIDLLNMIYSFESNPLLINDINNNEIIFNVNEYKDEIISTLLDEDFINNLNLNINIDNINSFINSFINLNENEQRYLLYSLKDYYKENELVYNYISSIVR